MAADLPVHRDLRPGRRDWVIAAVVAALTVAVTVAGRGPAPTAFEIVAAAVASGTLVLRRRWPAAVFVTSAVAAEMFLAVRGTHEAAVALAAPLVALYTVAESTERKRGLVVAAAAVAILAVAHIVLKPSSPVGAGTLALLAFGALAVAAGDASRHRRAYLAEVEARAARAEADRDSEAGRRVTEERLRLARELHDVIGHQLSVINIQSAVASHTLTSSPEQAREALAHVRTAGKAALAELRDTIGLLRSPHDPTLPPDALPPPAPSVGVDALPALYESMRRSGLTIAAHTGGTAYRLPAPVDLTAYRIVQESLTNVRRHAGPVSTTVTLDYGRTALRIEVVNRAAPRPAPAPDGTGHGLVGMRERVEALGGTLDYGPTADGGFGVRARMPVEVSRADPGPAG